MDLTVGNVECGVLSIMRKTLGRVDSRLFDHGYRVAFLVGSMLEYMDVNDPLLLRDSCMAALLHDIGAYKTEEISKMLQFETVGVWQHAIYGYLFVKQMSPLEDLADSILFHHLDYDKFSRVNCGNPYLAQLINFADRVDIFLQTTQMEVPMSVFERDRDKKFNGNIMDLFSKVNERDGLMERILNKSYEAKTADLLLGQPFEEAEKQAYLSMMAYSIDFRSSFTVVHTVMTVWLSTSIAKLMGFEGVKLDKIALGALLHDIGKVGTPVGILEFAGRLDASQMAIMQRHVIESEAILYGCVDPEVFYIAARHHEKMDGSGYPRGLKGESLSRAEKLVAVADVVCALITKRSYKDAFSKEKTISILEEMRDGNKLDGEVINTVIAHFDQVIEEAAGAAAPFLKTYRDMQAQYDKLMGEYGSY